MLVSRRGEVHVDAIGAKAVDGRDPIAILMTQRPGLPGNFDVYGDFWTLAYQAIDD